MRVGRGQSNAPRAATRIGRKDFTDLLDLPATASDDEVLATIDAKLAAKRAASEDEALYEQAYGRTR